MNDNTQKQALAILIHLSEMSGRFVSNNTKLGKNKKSEKLEYYRSKRENLKELIIKHWNHSHVLKVELKKFQSSL